MSAFVTPGSTHGDGDATVMLMYVDRCEICVATRGEERRGHPRVLHGCVGAVCEGQCRWLDGRDGLTGRADAAESVPPGAKSDPECNF